MPSGTPTPTPTPTATPAPTPTATRTARTSSSLTTTAATMAIALAAALGLTGCSVDAKTAKPETKRFAYAGTSLKLLTHEVATKLVATDRKDIKVTRWFDSAAGTVHLKWTLKGDTLDINAGCSGLALCDARFTVEVPKGITVTKDGHRALQSHQAHQTQTRQTHQSHRANQAHRANQVSQANQSNQVNQPRPSRTSNEKN